MRGGFGIFCAHAHARAHARTTGTATPPLPLPHHGPQPNFAAGARPHIAMTLLRLPFAAQAPMEKF